MPTEADSLRFERNSRLLNPSDHSAKLLQDLIDERTPGTCRWLFNADAYRQWLAASQSSILWLSGNAGCGKSVLLSSIIENLETNVSDDDIFVGYYYCTKLAQDEADVCSLRVKQNLVYSLYKQLKEESRLATANTVFLGNGRNQRQSQPAEASAAKTINSSRKKGVRSSASGLPDLDGAIIALARLLDRPIYLIIDAPDLCSDFEEGLKASIDIWSNEETLRIKVVVSTRPSSDLSNLSTSVQKINVDQNNRQDILSKTKSELAKIPGLTATERKLVGDAVAKKANNQFTYIALALNQFKQPWKRPVESVLAKLSEDMTEMYQQLLRDINPAYAELARLALQWTLLKEADLPLATIFDVYSGRYLKDAQQNSDASTCEDGEELNYPDEKILKDLIHKAVGQFINTSGPNNLLEIDSKLVADCFTRNGAIPKHTASNSAARCNECHQPLDRDEAFYVYEEDHILIATTILQHLNSSDFRKDHFRRLPAGFSETSSEDSNDEANEELQISHTTEEPMQHVNPAQDIAATQRRKLDKVLSRQVNNTGDEELDYDGYDSEDALRGDELEEITMPNKDDTSSDPTRYELLAWIGHIQSALNAFGQDESKCAERWQALWEQLRLFISNEEAWKTWLHTITSDDDDDFNPILVALPPLHFLAQIGLTWAARHVVQENPEAVRELADNGSGFLTLPLGMLAEDDEMNDHLELLDLLLTGLEELDSENLLDARRRAFFLLLMKDPSPAFLERLVSFYSKYEGSVSFQDALGFNALHYLAQYCKRPGLVPLLIEAGVDINLGGFGDIRPLYAMLFYGSPTEEILEEFLEYGADPNLETADSERPLVPAIISGNVTFVSKLISHGADIYDLNWGGYSAFHIAASQSKVEIMEVLLRAGSHLNEASKGRQRTALQIACANSTDTAAQYLLKKLRESPEHLSTRDIDQECSVGKTPLRKACASGQTMTVKALLNLPGIETRIHTRDKRRGRTPLHVSATKGHSDLVRLLLQKGAEVTLGDRAQKLPLDLCGESWHELSKANYPDTALALIEADRAAAATNRSIMMAAAMHGSEEVTKLLLECGADFNFKDDHGWSPILAAQHHGHVEVAQLLEEAEMQTKLPTQFACPAQAPGLISECGNQYRFAKPASYVALLADHPLPATLRRYYFEVTIQAPDRSEESDDANVKVGLTTFISRTVESWTPGQPWVGVSSWAFHGDDGKVYRSDRAEGIEKRGYKPFGPGDTIGCAIFIDTGAIVFTRNGKSLGVAAEDAKGRLFPTICLFENAKVSVNFGAEKFMWEAANSQNYTRFSK